MLIGEGVVRDLYEKESKGSIMTFIVIETSWRDEETRRARSSPSSFNLIHRRQAG